MTTSTDLDPVARLRDIVAALRHPQSGCPWDLQQDHASMRPHLIEEAYEVIEAIDAGDDRALCEELGDLAFQIFFHAQLAHERGAFELADVFGGIADKMTERHPHVFGEAELNSSAAVQSAWERRKRAGGRGVLDGVPRALPALQRAGRLTARAATVGFDWPDKGPVMDKIREELGELEALFDDPDPERLSDELGDLLFAVVNLARHLEVDAEGALRGTCDKFERRFRHVEARLAQRGRTPGQSDLDEMDALWDEAKAIERGQTPDPDHKAK